MKKNDESIEFEKDINDKVEHIVKKKLSGIINSVLNNKHFDVMLESSLQLMRNEFEFEIKKVLGADLNRAKKELSYIISPKIIDKINEFEFQVCNTLKDHAESITKFQKETLNKFQNEIMPISNLYITNEKIKIGKRINAETYVKTKLEKQGFNVVKQSCDSGIPDFAIYKKIGNDKNLLEMDSYDIMISEIWDKIGKKRMVQFPIDVEAPMYSEYPLYIEVKTNGDGLRMNQLEWIKNHPDNKVIVYCVEQIMS